MLLGKSQSVREADMHCPTCHGTDCVHIEIRVKDTDDPIQFYSCRQCEKKWWERSGDALALDDVLTLATTAKAR
jgi:transposase-like protein